MTCRDGSVLAGAWVSDAFESELDSELTSQAVEAAMGEAAKAKTTANAARQVCASFTYQLCAFPLGVYSASRRAHRNDSGAFDTNRQ